MEVELGDTSIGVVTMNSPSEDEEQTVQRGGGQLSTRHHTTIQEQTISAFGLFVV